MTLLSDVRDRFAGRRPTEPDDETGAAAAPGSGSAPIKGYDRLDSRVLMARFHNYSQVELSAIDAYERKHQNRIEVLQKLRFMRGAQPLEGYDDLSPAQISERLEVADLPTVKAVRDYERKFANRADVANDVARAHSEKLSARPAKAPPAYEPTSIRNKE